MENRILEILASLSSQALNYFFPGLLSQQEDDYFPCNETDDIPLELSDEEAACEEEEKAAYKEEKKVADIKHDTGIRFSVTKRDTSDPWENIRGYSIDGGSRGIYSPPRPQAPSTPEPAPKPKEEKRPPKKEPGLISRGKRALRKLVSEPEIVDQPLDDRAKGLLKELLALQDKYGCSIEELEVLLSYTVKVSHLRITKQHKIILDDFDKVEVKMDTLTKAVFLLYLKHPEGIRYKDLCDYRDELEDIYTSISGRSDMEAIRKSISDLTDSIMSNSINEKVSKARKAFRDVIDERIARFYYIDGKQGAAKNIALDRSMVIWE